MKNCNGLHCRCMEKNCPNTHYADCSEHNPNLKPMNNQSEQTESVGSVETAEILKVLNKHHSQEMKGRAGGAVMCVCGQGCGGSVACSQFRGLIRHIEKLQSDLADARKILTDSATLHVNILRGAVPLERAAALHIAKAGDYDQIKLDLAAARAEVEKLNKEVTSLRTQRKHHKSELTYIQGVLTRKNKELDALHYVWCSGGCPRGAARYSDEEITEEIVALAETNTKRLRAWFENRKTKAAIEAQGETNEKINEEN